MVFLSLITYCSLLITHYSYPSPDSSGYPTAATALGRREEYERIAGESFLSVNTFMEGFPEDNKMWILRSVL